MVLVIARQMLFPFVGDIVVKQFKVECFVIYRLQ
jgi:hypothetical protein